jgi:hypothetical protein
MGKRAVSKPKGTNRRGIGPVQNYNNSRSTMVQINDNMQFAQRSQKDKGILVVKEEPIGIIISNDSNNFGVLNTFPINPGQAGTFPLLSQEAAEYETYEFELLEFFTVPLVSEYAVGGQTGEVCLCVNFNASLPQPASQTAALTLEPCDANLPCLPLDIRCPRDQMCKRSNAKFVRTGNLPGQSDIKEYDVGNLFVTGEGLSATQFNVCRLFVRYRCRLFTRVNLTLQGAPINNSIVQYYSTESLGSTGVQQQLLLGTVFKTNGLNAVNTAGSIVLPAGNYFITFSGVFRSGFTTSVQQAELDLKFNGSSLLITPIYFGEISGAPGVQFISISGSTWCNCDGVNAISMYATSNFTAATNVSSELNILSF